MLDAKATHVHFKVSTNEASIARSNNKYHISSQGKHTAMRVKRGELVITNQRAELLNVVMGAVGTNHQARYSGCGTRSWDCKSVYDDDMAIVCSKSLR